MYGLGPFYPGGWVLNQNQPVNVYSYPGQQPLMHQGLMPNQIQPGQLPFLKQGGMNGAMVSNFPCTDLALPSPTSGGMNGEPMIPNFPSTNSVLPPQISGFNTGTGNSMMASFVKVNGDDNKITLPKNQSRCKCMYPDLDPKKPGDCLKCGGNINVGPGNVVFIEVNGNKNSIKFQ